MLLLTLLLLTPDLDEALEAATKAAAAKVAPSIVQIQTVGGAEVIGQGDRTVLRGRGPTTGLIVSPDGYLVSSSYNFLNKPAAITVNVPGNPDPLPAKIIAQDHTRSLTLLKIDAQNLPVAEAAPAGSVKLGQWAIALGRTWSEGPNSPPSVSVGIVSALGRIWGKAIQTDAKTSPVNWGGPLVDLQGRVLGILVPLSPRGDDELAGVEWYDGGIGFAIPYADFERVFPKLKDGKDLERGLLGVGLKGGLAPNSEPIVEQVYDETPAAKAGLLEGDIIIAVDGHPIERQAQLMHLLGPKYEGDTIALTIKRKDKEETFDKYVLTGPPKGHTPAWLGLLPIRDEAENSVGLRFVFPDSPAAKAGLKAGDRIVSINKRPLKGRDDLLTLLAGVRPGTELKLAVKAKAGGATKEVAVRTSVLDPVLPEGDLGESTAKAALKPKPPLPGQMPGMPGGPPPQAPKKDEKPDPTAVAKGFLEQKDPAQGRSSWLYVPEKYDPNISHGLVVWLHPAGDPLEAKIKELWKPICDEHHLILYAPRAENPTGWLTSEIDGILPEVRKLLKTYTIDRQRVVLHGLGSGANLALFMGFDDRDLVRGVAAVGGQLVQPAKDGAPGQRLSFYLSAGGRDPEIERLRLVKPQLAAKKYPVLYTERPSAGTGYYEKPEELKELARWVETLDRF